MSCKTELCPLEEPQVLLTTGAISSASLILYLLYSYFSDIKPSVPGLIHIVSPASFQISLFLKECLPVYLQEYPVNMIKNTKQTTKITQQDLSRPHFGHF